MILGGTYDETYYPLGNQCGRALRRDCHHEWAWDHPPEHPLVIIYLAGPDFWVGQRLAPATANLFTLSAHYPYPWPGHTFNQYLAVLPLRPDRQRFSGWVHS